MVRRYSTVVMPGTPLTFHKKIQSYTALKKNRSAHEDPVRETFTLISVWC